LQAWGSSRQAPKRIVLLEDIDTVFHGRENVVDKEGLSFSTVLNTIDGIEDQDGCLMFVTTNCVEHVDDALGGPTEDGKSTRPGRIDVVVPMNGVDRDGLVYIAKRLKLDDETAERLADQNLGASPAQFQEVCKRHALQELWGETQ